MRTDRPPAPVPTRPSEARLRAGHPVVGPAGRIHQKPDRRQVTACLPWLEAELKLVKPAALVCLGAAAAQALFGAQIRIGRDRGRPGPPNFAELTTLTAHPSAILRVREEGERDAAMREFVADLKTVAKWLSAR